jgi:nucleoside-diphosphate-sugar epimerase
MKHDYRRALVTGGTGFIGSTLVERLLREGLQVTCVIRPASRRGWLAHLPVDFWSWDFADIFAIAGAVAAADVVFHVAGVTRARRRAHYIQGNFVATRNLLAACAAYGPPDQKLIFVSSLAAAGPSTIERPHREEHEAAPVSAYGHSKLMAEKAVLEYSRERLAVTVRPPAVYGPRDRELLAYFKSIQRGLHPLPGRGCQRLSLVHVADLVEGLLLAAASSRAAGRTYYLCDDHHYDWHLIGRSIAQVLGRKPFTLPVPAWVLRCLCLAGGGAAWLTGEAPFLNPDKYKEICQAGWLCSNARAREELGFRPRIGLHEGLADTAAWYRRHGWLK